MTEATPGYSGKHYTVIAALGLSEVTAAWLLEEAMTREAFELARHAIAARGARLEFLPPYSPDLNPIERMFRQTRLARETQNGVAPTESAHL